MEWDEPDAPPEFTRRASRSMLKNQRVYRRRRGLPLIKSALVVALGVVLGVALSALWDVVSDWWHDVELIAPAEPLLVAPAIAPSSRLESPKFPRSSKLVLSDRVRSGDTLAVMFTRNGLSARDAIFVDNALRKLRKKTSARSPVRPGLLLRFELSEDGVLRKVTAPVQLGSSIEIARDGEDSFIAHLNVLPRKKHERVALGTIRTSFANAALPAGISYDIVDEVVDVFSSRVAFHRDFRNGDTFTVIFQEIALEDGRQIGTGELIAARLEVNGDTHVAIRYKGKDGKARYYDEKGKVVGNSFLRYPLKFSRISSTFSRARFHPVLKRWKPHYGVDFAAPTGTPIRAVADGVVEFAGWKGANGKLIKLRHGSRYRTAYAHLSRIAKDVRNGRRVTRGQIIGAVGTTGRSTGPHLHYAFYDRGKYVDPLKIKLPTISPDGKQEKVDPVYLKRILSTLGYKS